MCLNQGCILLTYLSVISSKFIQKFAQKCQYFTLIDQSVPLYNFLLGSGSAQRAKFLKKVHKHPIWANVVNFELNIAIQAHVMESKGEVRESLLQSQTFTYLLTYGNSALGT